MKCIYNWNHNSDNGENQKFTGRFFIMEYRRSGNTDLSSTWSEGRDPEGDRQGCGEREHPPCTGHRSWCHQWFHRRCIQHRNKGIPLYPVSRELMRLFLFTGTVTRKDGDVYLHLHIAVGDEEGLVHGGHLNRAIISATRRDPDPGGSMEKPVEFSEEIGLNLFKFWFCQTEFSYSLLLYSLRFHHITKGVRLHSVMLPAHPFLFRKAIPTNHHISPEPTLPTYTLTNFLLWYTLMIKLFYIKNHLKNVKWIGRIWSLWRILKSVINLRDFPIQGGMGVGISPDWLAGTVAKEGGIGIISTAQIGYREEDFDRNTEEAKPAGYPVRDEKGAGFLLTVSLATTSMVAIEGDASHVKVAVQAGADLIISGAGSSYRAPCLVSGSKTKIAPIVSNGQICKGYPEILGKKVQAHCRPCGDRRSPGRRVIWASTRKSWIPIHRKPTTMRSGKIVQTVKSYAAKFGTEIPCSSCRRHRHARG